MEIFKKITSECANNKKVYFLAKDLSRKLDINSNDDLENLKNLAYWLYIYDKKADSFQVCSILKNIDIPEEADLYTWIRLIWALYSRLLRENNNEKEANIYIKKIESIIKPKVLKRILNGELLYDSKINIWEERGDEESANRWRFLQFGMLALMRELGGSENFSIDKLEHEMHGIKEKLTL